MTSAPNLDADMLETFCRAHHVRRMSVFGSAVRDDFGPESDLDILVEFEPGYTPGLDFFSMQDDLSRLVGQPVDLNTPAFLSEDIKARVADEARVVYERA